MGVKLTSFSILVLVTQLFFPHSSSANNLDSPTYMVVSFDGMRHDFTKNYIDEGVLPNFKKVQNNGLVAEDIRTIYPSLTAASHAAISTGAKPGMTGMISNHLHMPNMDLADTKSAFFSPLDATPIWAEAREQGKTTATVLFPGSNPTEGNKATYAVYFGTTWAENALDKLNFKLPTEWTELPESFSPVKEATIALKLKETVDQKVYILASDSTDNKKTDYDTFYFYTKKNGLLNDMISENDWGSISFPINTNHFAGFSFKLRGVDPTLKDVSLYRTAVTSAVLHGPEQFQKNIASKFGFLPVEYDDKALEKGWITRQEYEDIHERFAKWTTDASLYIKERYKPDILFFYYPEIDHEEHKYLLVDPRQPGYTKKKSEKLMEYITWSYQLADRTIGTVLETMTDNDRLLIVSDHGMEPVHTMISPNYELEQAGLLLLDKDGNVDSKKSKAFSVASGAIAHIYINLEDREQNGIVSEKEFPEVQKEIADIFTAFKATEPSFINRVKYLYHRQRENLHNEDERSLFQVLVGSKENPFEKIVVAGDQDQDQDMEILQHEQAGDVLLIAKQGYYIGQDDVGSAVKKAADRGSHGGDPKRMELRPILYVTGGTYSKVKITEKVSTLDITPTLYQLMDLKAPDFVDGKVIAEMIKGERN
ncbi:alkaline phosphatase family protein [Sporosarcina sp. E16_8]|uniref:alkaline phosphatase family protein n=1 Tax=Sporosarcina sp. E16_8 TaxID=2789295 RepID=UPI002104B341|nr:alkaline phosphatase family protein [Sporosarcina sp. E16_8]